MEKLFRPPHTAYMEQRAMTRDGWRWLGWQDSAILDTNGDIAAIIGVGRDITDRKIAEKKLQDLNETMDLAQKMAGIGYWSYKIKTESRMWSSQMYENFGCNPVSGPPRHDDLKKVFHPRDWEMYENNFNRAMEGIPYDHIARVVFPKGEIHFIHTQGYPRKNESGDVTGLFGTSHDITDRILAEKALRESEEKYRRIFENSVVGFFQSVPEGRFTSVNSAFASMLGYTSPEELVASITDIATQYYVNPADRRRYQEILQQDGQVDGFEFRARCKDGAEIWVSNSTRAYFNEDRQVVRYEGVVNDITERKRAEEALQQTQKFEAIGTLAGGIAHDFNNILMGIQGRASLMNMDMDTAHPQKEHIEAIEDYVLSATHLTKQLLGFSRGGKYEVKPISVNHLLLNSADMFGRTRKEIQIHAKTQADPLVVEADHRQIEQVLLNLYINAWQAMPEGGDLYIETSTVALDESICKQQGIEPGRYAKMSITDTGIGMDHMTKQRIFDPFFTTKDKSRGTGLGLASSYGIVRNHGGMITVYSEIGHGSTFTIYLPISDKAVRLEAVADDAPVKGSETILLVDDEKMIREVASAMLEKLGYRVLVAPDGTAAVDLFAEESETIDLVLLDMIMPGMDGGTAFDRIREIRPQVPVILSSGYAISGHAEAIMQRGCNGFIQKPFKINELSRKVREILDAARRHG